MARGHVPQPIWIPWYQARVNAIPGVNCTEMARPIHAVAWHTEVGTFVSTRNWFTNPNNGALTDFQIGASWDGQYDGVIMRFIEADMGVAPYANGPVGKARPPFDEALAFLNRWVYPSGNLENCNAMARSIELSDGGQPDRDRSNELKQMESFCFLTAYLLSEEAGIGWDTYQPGDIFLHYQTGTDHVGCPGLDVKTNKAGLFNRVLTIMKAYQTNTPLAADAEILFTYPPGYTGPPIPQPGAGVVPAGFATPHAYPKFTGHDSADFKACARKVTVKRKGGAQCFAYAGRTAPASHAPLSGEVSVIYVVKNADGNWYVHQDGHRMLQSHFIERISYARVP